MLLFWVIFKSYVGKNQTVIANTKIITFSTIRTGTSMGSADWKPFGSRKRRFLDTIGSIGQGF
jgi:hypothetical protein